MTCIKKYMSCHDPARVGTAHVVPARVACTKPWEMTIIGLVAVMWPLFTTQFYIALYLLIFDRCMKIIQCWLLSVSPSQGVGLVGNVTYTTHALQKNCGGARSLTGSCT